NGRQPEVQLNIDATAMTIAGNGARYIEAILASEIAEFLAREPQSSEAAFALETRARFNPNLDSSWFMAVMQLVQNVTMMGLILTGAAVIREREHGTIEHLLVMPVTSSEIMVSKILANGGVIVVAALLSLFAVVQLWIGVPIQGSPWLFALGAAVYLFSITSLGILLSTVANSMQQFALLCIPVFVIMNMLSGGVTPLEAMPIELQWIMQLAPSTHYVSFSSAVLYRGAGLDIVWPQLAYSFLLGALFFVAGLARFRDTIAAQR
ncbi:MAG: ABC transporter permease, partial [Pseudomonadota bacterium]